MIWSVRDRATFAALARAERHARGSVSVRFVGGDGDEPPRVAYAVGGVASAVARNRLRRRLRAGVARAEKELLPGGAYLVSAGREALRMPFEALAGTVAALAREAGQRS